MKARLVICGQAPARSGDGRPFTGASGKRLVKLLGLRDYDELAQKFILTNISMVKAEKNEAKGDKKPRGDKFDTKAARAQGILMMDRWASQPEIHIVFACGKAVGRALTGETLDYFQGRSRLGPEGAPGVHVWLIPHPSGASSYWNKPRNHERVTRFFRYVLKEHYGIALDRSLASPHPDRSEKP